jgi:site-specific recombinase XerD
LAEAARIVVKQLAVMRERLTVSQLYARFMAAPGRRKSQAIPRRPLTLINLTWRLNRFERDFGNRIASEVTTSEVQAWLASFGKLSAISFNNHRRVLHAMFAYGLSEGYLASNPIAKISLYVVPHKAPPILTVDDAERLLKAAWASESSLGLLGFVVLGLFAGVMGGAEAGLGAGPGFKTPRARRPTASETSPCCRGRVK